jgi:hypothetical protein
LETEIGAELLSYKKEKEKVISSKMQKFIDFDYIMGKYDVLSKNFVHLMDRVNRVQEITVISS